MSFARHIGKPYRRGADGPDAFDCWGLVRAYFRETHAIEFDPLTIDGRVEESAGNVQAIMRSARAGGMRPQPGAVPRPEDVVLLRARGILHAGVAVRRGSGLALLHATSGAGVLCQPWTVATHGAEVEVWRRDE